MSQTIKKGVPHKILVKNRNPGTMSVGANTIVLLDGKPIKYCTFFKMEVKPKSLTKVIIEMYADVEFEGEVELEEKPLDDQIVKIGNCLYTLSRYETVGVPIPINIKQNSDIVESESQ